MPSFCGYASTTGEALSHLLRYSTEMRLSEEYYGVAAEGGFGLCAASLFSYPLPFRLQLGYRPFLACCLGAPRPREKPRFFSFQAEKMLLLHYLYGGTREIEKSFTGDFAFAIQDTAKGRLILAAFGEKKLYIGEKEGIFWFSSAPIAPCSVQIEKGLYRLKR